MSYPAVDIIVLTHNNHAMLRKCIELLRQHSDNCRFHVWDNGGDLDNLKCLQTYQLSMWFDLCRSNTNLGIVKGRNRAVETFLRFDRFIILDDDQMVGPGWLEPLQSKMEEGYDLVGHEAWRMIQPPNPRAYWPFRKCHSRDEPYSYLGCGGQLVSRKLYDKIGLYDEQFNPAYFEDPDLSFRAVRSGFKITWTPSNIEHVGHQTVNRQTLFNKTEQFSKSWHLFKQKWMPYYQEITKDGVRIYKPDVVPSAATG